MAANGDPANHSSASNKSVKKMKKRKELDALLTGSNGKAKHFNKPSKPPKKDGHELLIPDESDSLDSSDNDFFATSKKTIIRKPRPWRICATCIPLCIFVLTLACIVVTTGLIWMHMELKQDLDDLRERLAKVESDVQTSQKQAATVITLENKLEKLQGLIFTNQQALTQMKTLNQSIIDVNQSVNDVKTQVKAITHSNTAASDALQLQQEVANMGARVTELEEMKGSVKELQDAVTEASGNIKILQYDVHTLQAAQYQGTTPKPHLENTRPGTHDNYQEVAHILVLTQELDRFGRSMDDMNVTLNTIRQYQQGLDARLTLLEAIGGAEEESHKENTVSITPLMMTVFTKIHNDVNTLMNWYNETQLHTPTEFSKPTVATPIVHLPDGPEFPSSEDNVQWEHYVNDTLMELQSKLESLSADITNADTPDLNVTALIKQSLENFTALYKQDLVLTRHDIKIHQENVMNNLNNVQDRLTLVYQRLDELQRMINNGTDVMEGPFWQPPPDIFEPTKPPTVKFQNVRNIVDLENKFSLWDKDSDGYVLYKDLPDFMGPYTPPEEALMKFDANKDGRYDLQELLDASGLV
ncbi:EF-hand calcium-binding domain-containing protein 14-like isoform X2 [Amphiura filiformis]|uniref:EF-hand calcium-binding domain-containing protein 14-like isoform X2 n=1 Tax=Amphiura filiformis TaxID=82378 RepID=UPI003B2219D0